MIDYQRAEQAIALLLSALGEDISREGLLDTPHRVARMYGELLDQKDFTPTTFKSAINSHSMIIVRDIHFCSMCEHHLMPFCGIAHIAYVPNETILGLSKFARIVEQCAHRLQTQEYMTNQIGDYILDCLQTKNVAVYLEAQHMCMIARGVKQSGSSTITTKYWGLFEDHSYRQEFLSSLPTHS